MKKVTISFGLVALMILLGAIVGNLITNKASHLNTNLNKEYFEPIETKSEEKPHLDNTSIDLLKHYLIKNEFIIKTYRAEDGWFTVGRRITLNPRIEMTLEVYHLSLKGNISNVSVTIDGSRYNLTNEKIVAINQTANSFFSEIATLTNQANDDHAIDWICENVPNATSVESKIEHIFGTTNYQLCGSEFRRCFVINSSI